MNLSPLPIQKFFGNDGQPLVGGQLFTYVAGTSTKQATYTDSSGGTPNTNPIVLDYRGEARVWIDPTLSYKFVLAPATDTDPPTHAIWTVDNITAAPANQDNAAVDTGSVNAIALAIPQISSPVAFTRIVFKVAYTNTGPVTITINGGTAKNLRYQNTAAFAGGEILSGGIYEAVFDGTQWQLQGPAVAYWRTASEVSASVTPVNYQYDSGDIRRYVAGAAAQLGGWYCYGHTPTRIDGDTFTVPGDYTSTYSAGRRVRSVGTGGINESRILSSSFGAGVTTVELINDVSGNAAGLIAALPTGMQAVSVLVTSDALTKNAIIQDTNAIASQDFININVGTSAASRIVIGNYANTAGAANSNTSALAVVATGGAYNSAYLPGMATGRNIIIHTGLQIPLNFGTWDTLRFYIPAENGTYALPLVMFGALKVTKAPEGLKVCATSEPGNSYIGFYRSNETTRKGYIGFDSAGSNNNLTISNDETTSTARIIVQTAGNDITLASATDIQLAATNYVKISNGLGNYANDAAAAAGGVPVNGLYRNGSVVMIRVT